MTIGAQGGLTITPISRPPTMTRAASTSDQVELASVRKVAPVQKIAPSRASAPIEGANARESSDLVASTRALETPSKVIEQPTYAPRSAPVPALGSTLDVIG